jgi:hypothetical protein
MVVIESTKARRSYSVEVNILAYQNEVVRYQLYASTRMPIFRLRPCFLDRHLYPISFLEAQLREGLKGTPFFLVLGVFEETVSCRAYTTMRS